MSTFRKTPSVSIPFVQPHASMARLKAAATEIDAAMSKAEARGNLSWRAFGRHRLAVSQAMHVRRGEA